MERSISETLPGQSSGRKKTYVRPGLTLISFETEKGFATSVYGTAPDKGPASTGTTSMYTIQDNGVWD